MKRFQNIGASFFKGEDIGQAYCKLDPTVSSDSRSQPSSRGWTFGSLLGGSHLPGIDVTPVDTIHPSDLPKTKRKRLENDFARLFRQVPLSGPRGTQRPVETLHVHIPVKAEDGYYRLRVTSDAGGKNEIAVSPSFRVGSLSLGSASPRGATPIGLIPELLVRSSFEVARTAGEIFRLVNCHRMELISVSYAFSICFLLCCFPIFEARRMDTRAVASLCNACTLHTSTHRGAASSHDRYHCERAEERATGADVYFEFGPIRQCRDTFVC